jgi:hypothetical protein
MKITKVSLTVLGAVAALGLVTPSISTADEKPPGIQEKAARQPFKGKVEAMDASASTFTVGGKIIYVAPDTKLTRAGKTIALSDLAVGDEVHGTTRQTFDGKTEAVSVIAAPQKDDKF